MNADERGFFVFLSAFIREISVLFLELNAPEQPFSGGYADHQW
jgi:hypothetical protein